MPLNQIRFVVTDIELVISYKLLTILLNQLSHKLHGIGLGDFDNDPLKIPSILHSHCLMRIIPIRFFF